jgi:esterase
MKNNDLKLAAKVKGQGYPLIVLHGLFGSSDNLGRVASELSKDYQVHSIDLRNHGDSFHTEEMSYDLMAGDVVAYMDEQGLDRVSLLGHSMGGKVAMKIALIYSERVSKLIVADIAPVTYSAHHNEIFKGLLAVDFKQDTTRAAVDKCLAIYINTIGVRQFLMKNLVQRKQGGFGWKMNLSAIHKNYSKILEGLSYNEPYLGKVLFIGGGLSDYIKPAYKQQTLNLFPNTDMKIIPETSHWLHAEKPRIFIGICQRFLAV